MESLAVLFLGLGLLWLAQFALTWRQAQAFLRATRVLRAAGRVATGMGRQRPVRRAYVSLAADDAGKVTGAHALSGRTVFARPRPVAALVGLSVYDLARGAAMPDLAPAVRAAACQAAGLLARATSPKPG